jgi:hypothetical protein
LLFASASTARLVSNKTPAPEAALSALTVTSKLPVPSKPSGIVKVKERARAWPGISGAAAAPLNATKLLTITAPGDPSALRWRMTTRSW